MRAAFGGYLGPEMQAKAKTWAQETPDIKSLPAHVASPKHAAMRKAMLHKLRGPK